MAIKWSLLAPLACTVVWLGIVWLITLVGKADGVSVGVAAKAVALIVSIGIETRGSMPLIFIAVSTAALFHLVLVPFQYALLGVCILTPDKQRRVEKWKGVL
jgi:hypothetical protein